MMWIFDANRATNGGWEVVPSQDQRALFETIGYAISKSVTHFEKWVRMIDGAASRCEDCAPRLPKVFWKGASPYHNLDVVEDYERIVENRKPTFQTQVRYKPSTSHGMKDFDFRYVFNPVRLTHQAYGLLPKEKKAVLVKKAPIITIARIQPQYVDNLALQLKPFSQSLRPFSAAARKLADEEVPFPHTRETLMDCQKTTVAWMLKRERNPEPSVECEREEELIEGLQLRLLGDASRMIVRRGGIIADDIGFGKTVMTMALFSLQKDFDEDHHNLRLKKAGEGSPKALNCNLVICPPTIVRQWGGEIKKFLGSGNGHNFILVDTFAQLEKIKLEDHRIIVLSGSIFADKKYTEALASCVGEKLPFDKSTSSMALNKWRDGRAYSDWHASMAKKVVVEKVVTKKPFVLEQYSFNRIVWDEVSYENPAVSSFVTHSHAISRWLLSGTPPTGDLKEVCSLARTLGLHIARPLDLRLGLPRIAHGPSLSPRTPFEEIESYGMTKSSDFITERHQQAERFLSTYTACNKVDRAKHGFKVYEHVLLCPPTLSEASTYQALQAEVRSAHMDEEDMTPEGAKILRSATRNAQENKDGESESIKGLVLTATLPSLVMSSYTKGRPKGTPYHKGVLDVREGLMNEASRYVGYVFRKLIWLAVRLHRAINKPGEKANDTRKNKSEYEEITNSLSQLLKDLDEGKLQTFKGRSNYVELAKAILSVEEEEIHARLDSERTLLDATKDNSGPLHDAFATHDNNINLLYKRFNSKWPEFYLLDPGDTRVPKANIPAKIPDDDVVNLVLGLGLEGYSAKELKARAKTDKDKKALRGKLTEFTQDVMDERRAKLGEYEEEYNEKHPDENQNPNDMKPGELKEILNREGLGSLSARSVRQLAEILTSHKQKSAGFEAYKTPNIAACHAAKMMPFLGEKVTARGSTRLQTKDEYSTTWTVFTNACQHLYEQAAQVRCAKQFLKVENRDKLACSERGCESTNSLALVSQCGHVLCQAHQKKKYCGDGTSGCEATLNNGVIDLSRFSGLDDRQIRAKHLQSPGKPTTNAPGQLDSKLKYVIDLINAVPRDEFVVLFAQYQPILEKIRDALGDNGITCASTTNELTTTGLAQNNDTLEKFKNGEYKVLIMKVNSEEAAGGNLVIANHVIFLTPVIGAKQHSYDSHMRQASGRCIRHGQAKDVHVYHCVAEGTVEVNILELRQRKEVTVLPGHALGDLTPREGQGQGTQETGNFSPENNLVRSQISSHEVWKGLKEVDLSLFLDLVETRLDTTGAYLHQPSSSDAETTPIAQGTTIPALVHFADLPDEECQNIEKHYRALCEANKWPKTEGQIEDSDSENDSSDNEDTNPDPPSNGPPPKKSALPRKRKGPETGSVDKGKGRKAPQSDSELGDDHGEASDSDSDSESGAENPDGEYGSKKQPATYAQPRRVQPSRSARKPLPGPSGRE